MSIKKSKASGKRDELMARKRSSEKFLLRDSLHRAINTCTPLDRRELPRANAASSRNVSAAELRYPATNGTARSRYVPACGTGWYGENTGKVWSGGVEVLHREFMAEPWEPINHRTNIMDPNFRRVGIGAVQGPDAVYITMAFCR